MWIANVKATHIFSAKIIAYMPYLKISFNDTFSNDIVSFEQLGPGHDWNIVYRTVKPQATFQMQLSFF